ncbi:hypothetical protein HOU03_gp393 [Caulobacter phage CcrSC]|uniref:Uncharacterized protein n=1 Tax=Caulobacter phage CcrSC TaxID=2283272 RepID=A0A385EFQ7_9CAUD|nr:hypothetical protein HOU03_gp393 [Caulobacter phage CcrSC]AXQ69875.1 hypothetical protein CcrSC_gp293 [Caulobacter phage CcrSC]
MAVQLDLVWLVAWAVFAGTGLTLALLAENPYVRLWGGLAGGAAIALFFWKLFLTALLVFYVFGAVLWGLGALHNFSVAKGWLR